MKAFFILISAAAFLAGCNKNCREATLFYTPSCASYEGMVRFKSTNEIRVFEQQIDPAFRKDSIRVCIEYIDLGEATQAFDCINAPVIFIKKIKEL